MIRMLGSFLKSNVRNICLYFGFAGIFFVIFTLYNIPMEAVNYAFLLSSFWFLAHGAAGFMRYVHRHQTLLEAENRLVEGIDYLPVPESLAEEDYQRMLKRIYEEKIEQESEARISAQEMIDYYGMWVHQIKVPISALKILIQAHEEMENEKLESQETENQESHILVRDMKLELFKIEQYVELVLTYLRMESISSDYTFAAYSLDAMIKQAVRKYSRMFILKKIKLNYEPVEKKVLTDEKWLVFVFEQILSNALKYTMSGSISIYMKGGFLVFEDTGIGIYPEDLPRVFEKGFTGYNGRSDKKSTGIGLYLCKSVLDRLKHRIWIESEEGKGTKVYLSLERETLHVE